MKQLKSLSLSVVVVALKWMASMDWFAGQLRSRPEA